MEDRRTLESVTDGLVSKIARQRAEMIEAYITAFLIHTGLRIDEVEVIEYTSGDAIAWRLNKIDDSKNTCAVCKRTLHETYERTGDPAIFLREYQGDWVLPPLKTKTRSEDSESRKIRAAERDPNVEPLFQKSEYFDSDEPKKE